MYLYRCVAGHVGNDFNLVAPTAYTIVTYTSRIPHTPYVYSLLYTDKMDVI